MEKLIDLTHQSIWPYLELLLMDKTTGRPIIWATDTYQERGPGFSDKDPMSAALLLRCPDVIRPRIEKSLAARQARTKKKAEVFTPAWIVNKMNNVCDEDWFGRKDVFNREEGRAWIPSEEPVKFPDLGRRKIPLWQRYIDSRRLEITCGEAPYLASRYDVATGEPILPLRARMGQLDRKLRVVNENTETEEAWVFWALRALEACCGYEYQGDNLLIARINLFLTLREYYRERWHHEPDSGFLRKAAGRISWNLWQMDGLTDTVPLGKPYYQDSLFKNDPSVPSVMDGAERRKATMKNWRGKETLAVSDIKEKTMGKKLFDYVIGNPPYQDSTRINNRAVAVYQYFYDSASKLANKYLLISPARFLFNTGLTPKDWNKKMLEDPHLRVERFEEDASNVFPNTDIKGGIVIVYRDANAKFGKIGKFIPDEQLRSIVRHFNQDSKHSLPSIIYGGRSDLKFNDEFLKKYPQSIMDRLNAIRKKHPTVESLSPNEEYELKSSTLDVLSYAFYNEKPCGEEPFIKLLGLSQGKRKIRWIEKKYMYPRYKNNNIEDYKVLVPESNGSGKFGEILSTPIVADPNESSTPTFISIGRFKTKEEAENCLKYIKSKLVRCLLGVVKKTQHNAKSTWRYVPLQDFTAASDIDWTQSVSDIDRQLYAKYGLDPHEIDFIESHVKEMA